MHSTTNQLVEVVTTRHNHGIDPSLHVWGWEIPVYLFLGGLAAGLLVLPAVLEMVRGQRRLPVSVKLMPFAGLALISLGMVALFLDLEYKVHVLRFYFAFLPKSPMSWGSWILLLVYPAGLLLGLTLLIDGDTGTQTGNRTWWRALVGFCRRRRGFVLWSSIVAGIALGTYTGLLLGTISARPLWNTTILGPLFLVSGLSTAAAFMMLFKPDQSTHQKLAGWDMALIIVEIALIALFVMTLYTGGRVGQSAANELLGGPWTGAFWGLVVVLGLFVPLLMEFVERKRHLPPTVMVSVLILVGGFALRWILLAAGQATSYSMLN